MRPAAHLRDREQRGPTRTCVGCGHRSPALELVRVVIADEMPADDASGPAELASARGDAGVVFDLRGGSFGRGAHIHARASCLSKAPRGIARSFRRDPGVDSRELGRRLLVACDRRMTGLFLAARRMGCLTVGTAASLEAIRQDAPLAIIAVDAGAIVSCLEVAGAIAAGRAIAWKEKNELGALLGEQTVAICAVRNEALAAELKRMCAVASAGAAAIREGDECSKSREVR